MIIYIAGPMTGYPKYNREAFLKAEFEIIKLGHTPLNPGVLPTNLDSERYMPICLAMLEAAHAIVMLPGWKESSGATIEKMYAEYHDKRVFNSVYEIPEEKVK